MSVLRWLTVVALAGLLAVLFTGCSGTGVMDDPGEALEIARVDEYVGDGGGSAKPWPPGLPSVGAHGSAPVDEETVNTQAVAQLLRFGVAPITANVPLRQVNWFRIPALAQARRVMVTLQPLQDEDADLYILGGSPLTYESGALMGASRRVPTIDSDTVNGFAPDWVALDMGPTNNFPTAQVAVVGNSIPSDKTQFTIEVDRIHQLIANGGSLTHSIAGGQSNWYSFLAQSGKQYTVRLQNVTQGNPDAYAYGDTSDEFEAKNTTSGGGDVVFTANVGSQHYIRVYGAAAGPNKYQIRVQQP